MSPGERRRGPISATELMEQLAQDPEYQARRAAQDARQAARLRELYEALQPVLRDLAASGVSRDGFDHLYQRPELWDRAIPILLRHLSLDYPDDVLRAVGRTLPGRGCRPWWSELRDLYLRSDHPIVQDGLAAALSECAKREHYDDLLKFVSDGRLGSSRIYFLRPINRIGNRMRPGGGRSVVEGFAQDSTLGREASAILRGLGSNEG